MKTDKLLPLLTKINNDKQKLNSSKPKLALPDKTNAKKESSFRTDNFITGNTKRFYANINPNYNFGNLSVGPYGEFEGDYQDPKMINYGIKGSYDINPNLSLNGLVSPNNFNVGLNYKFQNAGQVAARESTATQQVYPQPVYRQLPLSQAQLNKYHTNLADFDSSYMAQSIPQLMNAMVSGQRHHTSRSNKTWNTYPENYMSRNLEGMDFNDSDINASGPYYSNQKYDQRNPNEKNKQRQAAYDAWKTGDKLTKSYLTPAQIDTLVNRYPDNYSAISYEEMLSAPDYKKFQEALTKRNKKQQGGNIKNIITNKNGQHLFPGQLTGIKGGDFNAAGDYATSLTGEGMLNNLLVLNPYGVNYLAPGTKQVDFPGDYQLEIPIGKYGGLPKAQYAGARISPALTQSIQKSKKGDKGPVITNSLGRIISTPESRAKDSRKKQLSKSEQFFPTFREAPLYNSQGQIIQVSDPSLGISIPDMILPEWQNPINYSTQLASLGKLGVKELAKEYTKKFAPALHRTLNTPLLETAIVPSEVNAWARATPLSKGVTLGNISSAAMVNEAVLHNTPETFESSKKVYENPNKENIINLIKNASKLAINASPLFSKPSEVLSLEAEDDIFQQNKVAREIASHMGKEATLHQLEENIKKLPLEITPYVLKKYNPLALNTLQPDTSQTETLSSVAGNNLNIYKNNPLMKTKFQDGGSQEQQIAQLIQMYAQLTGKQPEEIVQQIQALPQDQQQQALQAISQQVQQAMSQQQGQQQGMAKMGGCIDCEEQFPQAQDLEWYYKKAKGGEAFPQANVYPHMYQTAGTVQTSQRDNTYVQPINSEIYNLPHIGYKEQDILPNVHSEVGYSNRDMLDHKSTHYYGAPTWVKSITDPSTLLSSKKTYNLVKYPGDTLTDNQIKYIAGNNLKINDKNELEFVVGPSGEHAEDLTNARYQMSKKDLQKVKELKDKMSSYDKFASRFGDRTGHLPFAHYPTPSYYPVKAEGGEAFPQAQTYLPYDRPGETRPNFMFQTGGPKMKKADYEKAKKQYFDALHNYGQNNLSTEQYNQMQSDHANMTDDMRFYEPEGYWTPLPLKDAAYQIGNTGRNILNQVAGTHYQEGGEPDQYGGETDLDAIYHLMKKGGIAKDARKKNAQDWDPNDFQSYMRSGGALKKKDSLNLPKAQYAGEEWVNTTGPRVDQNLNSTSMDVNSKSAQKEAAVNNYVTTGAFPQGKDVNQPYNPYTNPTQYKSMYNTEPKDYMKTPRTTSKGAYKPSPKTAPYNSVLAMGMQGKPGGFLHGISAVVGLGDALNTAASGYKSATQEDSWNQAFGPKGVGVVFGDRKYLPTHQWGTQGTGMQGQGQPLNSFKPVAGAWNNYNANNAQQTMHNTITDVQSAPMHLKENQSYMNDTSKIPNTGITGNQKNPNDKTSQPRISGIPKANRAIAGLSNFANFLESVDENKQQDKLDEKLNTSEFMPVMTAQLGGMLDYGDYSINPTQGPNFRPNSYVYAQKESNPYQEVPLYYMQEGGSSILDKYNDDQEYDLPLEEILKILAAGGSVEYLD